MHIVKQFNIPIISGWGNVDGEINIPTPEELCLIKQSLKWIYLPFNSPKRIKKKAFYHLLKIRIKSEKLSQSPAIRALQFFIEITMDLYASTDNHFRLLDKFDE